jgi:hypothetical protein
MLREGFFSRMNWISPAFPMWLTLAAAVFFGVLVLITLVRAEKSVANGALTVIALLAVGIAVAATIRGYGPPSEGRGAPGERASAAATAAVPALSCLDEMAGDVVLAACEKAVFASAESTAAAVSYVASQITRLTSFGDLTTASQSMTPDLQVLRRSIERDRFGLVAQVLQVRDHCTPTKCAVFRSLTDNHQIITNMDEHFYDRLISRYSAVWNTPAVIGTAGASPAMGALAAFPPSVPTGRPTNADFPSAASTPPVSIMLPEPGTGTPGQAAAHSPSPPASASTPASRPSPNPTQSSAAAAAKKPPSKPSHPSHPSPATTPTQISPAPSAPAASND